MTKKYQTWEQYLIKGGMGLWKELYEETGERIVYRFHWCPWKPIETETGELVRFGRYVEIVPPRWPRRKLKEEGGTNA